MSAMLEAAGPGHWNDPDQLVTGNPGLSLSEQQAQFALWSIFAAPLLVSTDLQTISAASRDILLNREVIAVNQDAWGRQGYCVEGCAHSLRVYVRELAPLEVADNLGAATEAVSSRRWAVVLANFNPIFGKVAMTFAPRHHLPERLFQSFESNSDVLFSARDILAHEDLGIYPNNITVAVEESSVVMIVVTLMEASDVGLWAVSER
jgi:Alpha galactosidase A